MKTTPDVTGTVTTIGLVGDAAKAERERVNSRFMEAVSVIVEEHYGDRFKGIAVTEDNNVVMLALVEHEPARVKMEVTLDVKPKEETS